VKPADHLSADIAPYLRVTPAGAYHAVAARQPDPARLFLLRLLMQPSAGYLESDRDGSVINRLLALGWLERTNEAAEAPTGSLERLLPDLLPRVSARQCAVLADHQGLPLGFSGVDETKAQGLAALSAAAVGLGRRYREVVGDGDERFASAWAMVDAAGNSQIGVWPLFLPGRWFALVIAGRPLFTHAAFQHLVWSLARRCSGVGEVSPGRPLAACPS
jgi:hypothetical protein